VTFDAQRRGSSHVHWTMVQTPVASCSETVSRVWMRSNSVSTTTEDSHRTPKAYSVTTLTQTKVSVSAAPPTTATALGILVRSAEKPPKQLGFSRDQLSASRIRDAAAAFARTVSTQTRARLLA
jgi:hypothetical protein